MTEPAADAASEPENPENPETEESPEPFANRAARRAKGKTKQDLNASGARQLRSGNVQSPRQYGNRRSG